MSDIDWRWQWAVSYEVDHYDNKWSPEMRGPFTSRAQAREVKMQLKRQSRNVLWRRRGVALVRQRVQNNWERAE